MILNYQSNSFILSLYLYLSSWSLSSSRNNYFFHYYLLHGLQNRNHDKKTLTYELEFYCL